MRRVITSIACLALAALGAATPSTAVETPTTFAIIGDYGTYDGNELAVANLVKSWAPAYVVATGDDYYGSSGTGTGKYDLSTGQYYCPFLKDAAVGAYCPTGGTAAVNGFFPVPGNHDYSDAGAGSLATYQSYFTLPGTGFSSSTTNERYYDFIEGPVHFFMVNSNAQEVDGIASTSTQAQWLQGALAASTSPWDVVVLHHPPYSSDSVHGSTTTMRWPFAQWGADVVLSGHAHTYERLDVNGMPYIVNGLGGASRYGFGTPLVQSVYRYNSAWGAQRVTATSTSLTMEFRNTGDQVLDSVTLTKGTPPPVLTMHVGALAPSSATVKKFWTASVTITVHDAAHAPLSGVTVGGNWSAGSSGSATCVTAGNGTCRVSKANLKAGVASVRYTVAAVNLAGYTAGTNDITTVQVFKP